MSASEREQCCTCAFCSNRACRDCHIHWTARLPYATVCSARAAPASARTASRTALSDVTFCADCFEAREVSSATNAAGSAGVLRSSLDNLGCAAIRGCSGCDTFVCASCCGEDVPIASLGMPVRELPQLAPIAALEAEVLRAFGAREADLAKEEDTEELMHRCTLTLTPTLTLTLTQTVTLTLF